MPLLNPLTAIAGPESSFGQNLQNPGSSASGIYGVINGTWQANLKAIGGDPAQYPTAKSAPASVQSAVVAYDYNQNGFKDWLCAGCDAVFTQEVANAGGPAAYAPPGSLSINPADYASLDAPGGLQAFFTNNSGGSFVGAAPISQAAAGDSSPNASPTGKPFSYAYTLLVTGSAQGISTNIQNVQNLVHPWLSSALALSIMVIAIATMLGKVSINTLFSHVIRVSLVVAFVAPGSAFYTNYVISPVIGLPSYLSSGFGVPNVGPAAVFDDAYITLWTMTETILNNTHISWSGDGLGVVIAAIVLYDIGAIALVILFLPYLVVNYLLLLMLVLGPIAIVAALFRILDRWLVGFVDTVATLAVLMLAIDVVIALYQGVMVQMFNGFVATGVGDKDVPAFAGLVGVLGVMAWTVFHYLPTFVGRIFGGVGIGLQDGTSFLGRQAARAVRLARS